MKITILHLSILINFSTCRDFYLGMFKKNDLLMSQDTLYKERVPFRYSYAKYGRTYKCPITYVRVLDRLNIGRGPRVEVVRGGLRKKYIALRLTSPYNSPISVNIFVGCANKKFKQPPWKIIRPTKPDVTTKKNGARHEESTTSTDDKEKEKEGEASTAHEENTTSADKKDNGKETTTEAGTDTTPDNSDTTPGGTETTTEEPTTL